jgi:hypothetical protein
MAGIVQQTSGASVMSIAESELRSGKKLIWAERPQPMSVARGDFPTALIGIPFTAFAIF